ncbi:MAG: hypothetical protein HRF42_02090 [Candidatus Brocadia sp.]
MRYRSIFAIAVMLFFVFVGRSDWITQVFMETAVMANMAICMVGAKLE